MPETNTMSGKVILIPIALAEDGYDALPASIATTINACQVFFAENTRTARRAFKKIDKSFDIDARIWHETGQAEEEKIEAFKAHLKENKTIGIVSESGCPGIADPGQKLVAVAHEMKAQVKPFSGPSSILLALMASGMNGQHFTFNGYLPIQTGDREKMIKTLEKKAVNENCTQLFIETPYRNNQMLQSLQQVLQDNTKLCIAYHLTSADEWVMTKKIGEWKKNNISLPKEPAIFIIGN